MGLLTVIDNVPLYDSMREAKTWAKQYNLTGSHIHYFNGVKGYMGGSNHAQITSALQQGVQTALSALELNAGNFIVTDNEIQFYQLLNQHQQQAVDQQGIQTIQEAQVIPQVNTPQATPTSQPSTPNYTPPSTGRSSSGSGGGSSSGGGGY